MRCVAGKCFYKNSVLPGWEGRLGIPSKREIFEEAGKEGEREGVLAGTRADEPQACKAKR